MSLIKGRGVVGCGKPDTTNVFKKYSTFLIAEIRRLDKTFITIKCSDIQGATVYPFSFIYVSGLSFLMKILLTANTQIISIT